jgi:FAD/FMN-containing dehydrogenase
VRPPSRRDFLRVCGAGAISSAVPFPELAQIPGVLVNDVQTEMNPTRVARVIPVRSAADAKRAIQLSKSTGKAISIAGGRHAAGGQQFGTNNLLIDTQEWNQILHFDQDRGLLTVAGGIEWPEIMSYYLSLQKGKPKQWGIAQKQGGLDRLTIGGTLSANAHGHTLGMPPIVANIESFELLDAAGEARICSRESNAELFRTAIGGYGLFGIISQVTLRLVPRTKLRRNVAWANSEDVIATLEKRAAGGSLYGDFQFSIDETSPDFVSRGILTTYDPVDEITLADDTPRELSSDNLEQLLLLAHTDRAKAFRAYADATLPTSGEVVWSDTHQYSPYPRGYHHRLDQILHAAHPGSDPLSEVYVPRSQLVEFLAEARRELLARKAIVIYGTVRLIQRDSETFLAWAKESYACVIFTIHTDHTPEGVAQTADTFSALIAMAIARGGSYYLTYNRFANLKLLDSAYPQFSEFLRLKTKYDPQGMFQSDWYRHYSGVLG